MLPAAGAPNGRVFRLPERIVSAHRHGHCGRAAPALWAVEGRGHALTPSQQQLSGAEVTCHRGRTPLHHPAVVVGAAERAAEQTVGSLPPMTVDGKSNQGYFKNYVIHWSLFLYERNAPI